MYRSRLQRVEEKRNIKKSVFLMIGTVLVLGALVVWGVPVLVKLAVFLGNINSSRKPIDKSDLIPPAPPSVLTTFEATNSATQVIRGWAEPGATVFLTNNSSSLGSVVAKDNGEFAFSAVTLSSGRNEFVAVAVDGGGNKSLESVPITIQYWDTQPKLEISTPADGQKISGSDASVEVKGQTDSSSRLTINGRVVVKPTSGDFSTRVNLNEGENTIVLEVVDKAGNRTKKELKIVYAP